MGLISVVKTVGQGDGKLGAYDFSTDTGGVNQIQNKI
jgi:hypothetical protein